MNTGDIVLVPFPFAEQTDKKLRPAVVIAETQDKYKDTIVAKLGKLTKEELAIFKKKFHDLVD